MKYRNTYFLYLVLFSILFFSCTDGTINHKEINENALPLHSSMKKLSDIIVYDIFSPPVASRVYAYPSIAAYEVVAAFDEQYLSLASQIKHLEPTPKFDNSATINMSYAAVHAFNTVAKALIFSEDKMETHQLKVEKHYKDQGLTKKIIKESEEYGQKVAEHILAWSKGDMYNETRSYPKFDLNEDPARWKPTPPGYFDGIEPHWREIRPFVIENANQFAPPPPTPYDMTEGSTFYQELMEVYEVGKSADKEQQEIASFWDCNPFVMNVTGHVMHASKKITPGGHWMGITGLVAKKDSADFAKSAMSYALTSIALADGFISCWDEKYRSNLTRPETVINETIDEDWMPLLQTPPFPEYTSGHSVISRAAAVALTSIYGENFQFDDTVEIEYGLPMRSFDSFYAASEEAAVSRLYGGIHYRPAIEYGVVQGEQVGKYIINKLKLKE